LIDVSKRFNKIKCIPFSRYKGHFIARVFGEIDEKSIEVLERFAL